MATRKALEEWSGEEIDELATETCECVDARIYAHKKGQKERANARIDLKDGKGVYSNVNGFSEYAIGKNVFLTKEAAEAALKEL